MEKTIGYIDLTIERFLHEKDRKNILKNIDSFHLICMDFIRTVEVTYTLDVSTLRDKIVPALKDQRTQINRAYKKLQKSVSYLLHEGSTEEVEEVTRALRLLKRVGKELLRIEDSIKLNYNIQDRSDITNEYINNICQ